MQKKELKLEYYIEAQEIRCICLVTRQSVNVAGWKTAVFSNL